MMQINRSLKDEHFDHIDHALGRPVNPMGETYRNYFSTSVGCDGFDDMENSDHWLKRKGDGEDHIFHVTEKGKEALSNHLVEIGDKNKVFYVSFYGAPPTTVIAESASKAKYSHFLNVCDCFPDLTFGEFCKTVWVSPNLPHHVINEQIASTGQARGQASQDLEQK